MPPPGVTVLDHPLILHKLAHMRDRTTSTATFRRLLREIAMLMGYEVFRELPLEEAEVETPLARTRQKVLAGRKLALVPVLRAGLGMADGLLELVPSARIGHVGVYRDHATREARSPTTTPAPTPKPARESRWPFRRAALSRCRTGGRRRRRGRGRCSSSRSGARRRPP